PAAGRLAAALAGEAIAPPRFPLYLNATARPSGGAIAADMARQAAAPVLWRQTLENMAANGVDTFVEAGPGAVLTGLTQKTLPGARAFYVEDGQSLEKLKNWLAQRTGGMADGR
ncbi:MAG: ACP S-malonyltransferase, partial [Clostridiales bacterium]|nr:ACP S-malonyltransferase [Clostridiales bacterium]